MQLSNFHLGLPELNPDLEIPLLFTNYPLHRRYPIVINTFTNPRFPLNRSLFQYLTLRELKDFLALEMDMDAQSIILKHRGGVVVGEWLTLDGEEKTLREFVEQGFLKSRSEIRVEAFDYHPQSIQPYLGHFVL